jgi:multiple sugar transport system permease protein
MLNRRITLTEKVSTYTILIVLGIVLGAPFLFMISISLASDTTTAQLDFSFVPTEFHFENYVKVFTEHDVGKYIVNSLIIVVGAIIGQVFASSFVAYGFARFRAPGKNIIFLILLSTMMIPSQVTMIPQFYIFTQLEWYNTFLPLIVPNFFGGAFNIFLIRQFIARIPKSLDDAARLDGLGALGIYRYIVLPLIKPILFTVAIFTFQWNWGWFLGPLIYLPDLDKAPLALGVKIMSATTSAGATPEWNIVMVASMLLTLPMILVFFFGQRYMFEANIMGSASTIK